MIEIYLIHRVVIHLEYVVSVLQITSQRPDQQACRRLCEVAVIIALNWIQIE